MSSDKQLLEACSKRCGAKLVHFDLVTVHLPEPADETSEKALAKKEDKGPKFGKPQKAYLCIGQSELFLLRRSLSRLLDFGRVAYAHIEKVVEDASSRSRFMVVLNKERPQDNPEEFLVDAESSDELLSKIANQFLADSLLRLGSLAALPRLKHELAAPYKPGSIAPFKGFKLARYTGYSFFIRDEFQELPDAISKVDTGVYAAPVSALKKTSSASWGAWIGSGQDAGPEPQIEVLLNVLDPIPLSHLLRLGREHVRWVALECKQALLRNWSTLVLKNQPYLKKMNLSNDVSSWQAWELLLQDKDFTWVVVLLRRQFVPPMLDSVQDCILSIKCPSSCVENGTLPLQVLLHEAHLMADSFSPLCSHPHIYPDLIQAKLDALLYDEDAYEWISTRLRLRPQGKAGAESCAVLFVKGVLKHLYDEHVITALELVKEVEKIALSVCGSNSEDLEPLEVAQRLSSPGEGLPRSCKNSYDAACAHAWQARAACYLAYRLDGSLLGPQLTLADLIAGLHNGAVSKVSKKSISDIVTFLLHLRPKDLRRPFKLDPLTSQLESMALLSVPGSGSALSKIKSTEKGSGGGVDQVEQAQTHGVHCMFNTRVMQALIETGHLREALLDETSVKDCFSLPFAKLLSNLLLCDTASVNLKASICRLIISDNNVGEFGQSKILCMGLMDLVNTGSVFLATYACAALVNLSQSRDSVKACLISLDVASACRENLKSKDNDLMLYTLMLLVHLTKRSNHRQAMSQVGIHRLLIDMFLTIHLQIEHRRRVLSELCSVLGQLCNDEHARAAMSDPKSKVVDNSLELLIAALELPSKRNPGEFIPETSAKLLSKAMYFLKQLLAVPEKSGNEKSAALFGHIVDYIVKDMRNQENLNYQDWTCNAILLLDCLSTSSRCCQWIKHSGWSSTSQVVLASKIGSKDFMREKVHHITKSADL